MHLKLTELEQWKLEREHRGIFATSECIDKGLAHEKPNSYTNRDCDHRAPNVNALSTSCDAPRLRQSRLIHGLRYAPR